MEHDMHDHYDIAPSPGLVVLVMAVVMFGLTCLIVWAGSEWLL